MSYGTIFLIWFVGTIILLPSTRIAISKMEDAYETYKYNKNFRIVIYALVFLSLNITGAIPSAAVITLFQKIEFNFSDPLDIIILIVLMVATLVLILAFCLGVIWGFNICVPMDQYSYKTLICYLISFIVAVVLWTIPVWNYNSNIETTTETNIESKQELELVHFCGIPVKELMSQDSDVPIDVSKRTASESAKNLDYWYLNADGECLSNTVTKDNVKIIYTDDLEYPYVDIQTYIKEDVTIDHNKDEEKREQVDKWKKYTFYLPEEALKYAIS